MIDSAVTANTGDTVQLTAHAEDQLRDAVFIAEKLIDDGAYDLARYVLTLALNLPRIAR